MPGSERTVVDQAVRDRAVRDLGTTYLLEAGAGTGKTRVLVDRYVNCVLDREQGTGDVRTVAAITFTEKAAGELRQRVREEFEARARAAADPDEIAVIEGALDALDDAPIGTIHGFAGRLLREFPVEAGVDPAFEQLDALGAEIERARLWDEWLAGLAGEHAAASAADGAERPGERRTASSGGAGALSEGSERSSQRPATPDCAVHEWLARLLRNGVRLDHVRQLAAGARGVFGERYDLDPVTDVVPEPDLTAELDQLLGPLEQLADFCASACTDQSDKGFVAAMELVEAGEDLMAAPPAEIDGLAGKLHRLPANQGTSAPGGAKKWDAAQGGKDELQLRYQELVAAIVRVRGVYAEYVTGLAVAVADAFARWAGEAQVGLGRLDFTDLLGRLRDLLTRDLAARAALQRRFRYLLVDEFQDTDPLQCEIVFLLCERRPLAADWRQVVLEPGKLFVVGDPKQSIYRFRRADIAMYDEAKKLVAGQPDDRGAVEAITQNFRTTPAIVEWVNRVFADVFESDKAEGRQPGYQPVHAFRPPADGPGVAVLLGRQYESRMAGENDSARRDEARAVAALLCQMRDPAGTRWHVQDRDHRSLQTEADVTPPVEPTRPPRWSDIALLFRTTTGLETYEQALREAGVPYRVDGGTTYFSRREVADALLCLRAVDDPSDGPALYGALHSTLFGFSDDELFLFWSAGGRFDMYADRQPSGHEDVVAALRLLRELHELRGEREPHELAAELVERTRASEIAAATGSAARRPWRTSRSWSSARGRSRAPGEADWARSWRGRPRPGDAAGEQESPVDDAGDVVRLLTIHKAKGLEYPIVILVGGALASGGGGREPVRSLVDRGARRLSLKLRAELPGAAACELETRLYADLREREKEMETSEMRRLLYVAATRARDHVVVSCFGKLTTKQGEPAAGVMLAPIGGHLPVPGAQPPATDTEEGPLLVLAPVEPSPPSKRGAAPDVAALVAERETWRAAREALLADASRPARATSPSGLEHVDEEVVAGGPGAPPGRAAARVRGSAVHAVMELCDLHDEASIDRLAPAVAADAGRPDLAPKVAALAHACWRSAPARAAAASPQVYRELPVGFMVDDAVVTGAVDLLYLDGEQWVIVDYKTDRLGDETDRLNDDTRRVDGGEVGAVLRERYSPQAAAYAVAVEKATGRTVREVVLVAASAGGEAIRIAVDDALRATVARDVRQAVTESRAVVQEELVGG